jgi:hypothetical protein
VRGKLCCFKPLNSWRFVSVTQKTDDRQERTLGLPCRCCVVLCMLRVHISTCACVYISVHAGIRVCTCVHVGREQGLGFGVMICRRVVPLRWPWLQLQLGWPGVGDGQYERDNGHLSFLQLWHLSLGGFLPPPPLENLGSSPQLTAMGPPKPHRILLSLIPSEVSRAVRTLLSLVEMWWLTLHVCVMPDVGFSVRWLRGSLMCRMKGSLTIRWQREEEGGQPCPWPVAGAFCTRGRTTIASLTTELSAAAMWLSPRHCPLPITVLCPSLSSPRHCPLPVTVLFPYISKTQGQPDMS